MPNHLNETRGVREIALRSEGKTIIGIDEVGRGCLAGPVYAAAVCLDYSKLFALDQKILRLIRDSKTLSAKQRNMVRPIIQSSSIAFAIESASSKEIGEIGIIKATFLAMSRAFHALKIKDATVLIDGNQHNSLIPCEQEAIVRGDNSVYAIAAASILAKEARDAFMIEVSKEFPHYKFEKNVGYGTKCHLLALEKYGITPQHRSNFRPIERLQHHGNRIGHQ